MKKITVERIVFDPEEQQAKKTWGSDWPRIWKDVKKNGWAAILVGTWSGYGPGQSKVCHTEYVRADHADGMRLNRIMFTDGTALSVEIRKLPLEAVLKTRRMPQYDGLVRQARESMQEYYYIGQENAPRAEPPTEIQSFSGFDTPEQASAMDARQRIHEEQKGNNWYDKM